MLRAISQHGQNMSWPVTPTRPVVVNGSTSVGRRCVRGLSPAAAGPAAAGPAAAGPAAAGPAAAGPAAAGP